MVDFRAVLKPGKKLEVRDPETGGIMRWSVLGLLQEGGRGIVFEVVDQDGRPAVLKAPSKAAGAVYSAIIEREILKKISPHPNVVKYLGATDEMGVPLVVVGWAHENPFLRLNTAPTRDRLGAWRDADSRGVALPATTAIEFFFEVVLALEHLHSKGFVHSDVKPANVMLEVNPTSRNLSDPDLFRAVAEGRARAVLIDVGGARSESFLEDLNSGNVDPSIVPPELTPLYAPPEAVVGAETREGRRPIYSAAIDVYAAGLVLGVFLTGRAPYEHLGDRYDRNDLVQLLEMKAAERRGDVTAFPPEAMRTARHDDVNWGEGDQAGATRTAFDEAVTAILTRTLHPDAKERGTISQLRVYMERAFDLFPNPKARGGAVVAPVFRARARTLKLENRLTAAAGLPGQGAVAVAPDAAEQVLRLAASLRAEEAAAAPPPAAPARAPTGRVTRAPDAPAAAEAPPQPLRPPSGEFPLKQPLRPPSGEFPVRPPSGEFPVKEPGTRTIRTLGPAAPTPAPAPAAPAQAPLARPSQRLSAQAPTGSTRIAPGTLSAPAPAPAAPQAAAPAAGAQTPPSSPTAKLAIGAPVTARVGPDAFDRVVLRVAPKDTGKTFQLLSEEGVRALEIEGSRFEFRSAPARSSDVLRAVLEAKVDVYFFERKRPTVSDLAASPATPPNTPVATPPKPTAVVPPPKPQG